MTSPARKRANRANARFSTGPRTPAGKAVARLNALRHGLNQNPAVNPDFHATVASIISGILQTHPGRDQAARAVAEARFDLQRIAIAKTRAISLKAEVVANDMVQFNLPEAEKYIAAVGAADAAKDLETLHSYERRASSRLNRALKKLLAED